MDGAITVEMGYQKTWRYLHLLAKGLNLVRPVILITLGFWAFFFAPSTLDDSIDLSKRELLGITAILLGMMEANTGDMIRKLLKRNKVSKLGDR